MARPSNKTQADRIISFLKNLKPDFKLPLGVEILNPFEDKKNFALVKAFYKKYYSDSNRRYFIFGINPGRLGGGITGIPFTDPEKLQNICGIANQFPQKKELSASFIYAMIEKMGGAETFYKDYFITAVCPLGFIKDNRNLNYYDDPKLIIASESFILDCIKVQCLKLDPEPVCFCLGEGDNFRYLNKLNKDNHYFERIIALPHPRWIMQYRRKKLNEFIQLYQDRFQSVR